MEIILSNEQCVFNGVTIREDEINKAARAMIRAFGDAIPAEKQTCEALEHTLKAVKRACAQEVPLNLEVIFSDLH